MAMKLHRADAGGGSGTTAAEQQKLQDFLKRVEAEVKTIAARETDENREHGQRKGDLEGLQKKISGFISDNPNLASDKAFLAIKSKVDGLLDPQITKPPITSDNISSLSAFVTEQMQIAPLTEPKEGEPKKAQEEERALMLANLKERAKKNGEEYAEILLGFLEQSNYDGLYVWSSQARAQCESILSDLVKQIDRQGMVEKQDEILAVFAKAAREKIEAGPFGSILNQADPNAISGIASALEAGNASHLSVLLEKIPVIQKDLNGISLALKKLVADGQVQLSAFWGMFSDQMKKAVREKLGLPEDVDPQTVVINDYNVKEFINAVEGRLGGSYETEGDAARAKAASAIVLSVMYGTNGEVLNHKPSEQMDVRSRYVGYLRANLQESISALQTAWGQFKIEYGTSSTEILTARTDLSRTNEQGQYETFSREVFDITFVTSVLGWHGRGRVEGRQLPPDSFLYGAITRMEGMPPYTPALVFQSDTPMRVLYDNLLKDQALFEAASGMMAGYLAQLYNSVGYEKRFAAMNDYIGNFSFIGTGKLLSDMRARWLRGTEYGDFEVNAPYQVFPTAYIPADVSTLTSAIPLLYQIGKRGDLRGKHYETLSYIDRRSTAPILRLGDYRRDLTYRVDYSKLMQEMLQYYRSTLQKYSEFTGKFRSYYGEIGEMGTTRNWVQSVGDAAFRAEGGGGKMFYDRFHRESSLAPSGQMFSTGTARSTWSNEMAVRNLGNTSTQLYNFLFNYFEGYTKGKGDVVVEPVFDRRTAANLHMLAGGADVLVMGNYAGHRAGEGEDKESKVDAQLDVYFYVSKTGTWLRTRIDAKIDSAIPLSFRNVYGEWNQEWSGDTETSAGAQRMTLEQGGQELDRRGFFFGWQTGWGEEAKLAGPIANLDASTVRGNSAVVTGKEFRNLHLFGKKKPATLSAGYLYFSPMQIANPRTGQQAVAPGGQISDRGQVWFGDLLVHEFVRATYFGGQNTQGGQIVMPYSSAAYVYRIDPNTHDFVETGTFGGSYGRVASEAFAETRGTKAQQDQQRRSSWADITQVRIGNDVYLSVYGRRIIDTQASDPVRVMNLRSIQQASEDLAKEIGETDLQALRQNEVDWNRKVGDWGYRMARIAESVRAYLPTDEFSSQLGDFSLGIMRDGHYAGKIVVSRMKGENGQEMLNTTFYGGVDLMDGVSVVGGFPILKKDEKGQQATQVDESRIQNVFGAKVNFGNATVTALVTNLDTKRLQPAAFQGAMGLGGSKLLGGSLINLDRDRYFRDFQAAIYCGNETTKVSVDGFSYQSMRGIGISGETLLWHSLYGTLGTRRVWEQLPQNRKIDFYEGRVGLDWLPPGSNLHVFLEGTGSVTSPRGSMNFGLDPGDHRVRFGISYAR